MRPTERILVPTDFSEAADRALLHALGLARESGAELHLLHAVVMPDGEMDDEGLPGRETFYHHLEESAMELLARLVDPYRETASREGTSVRIRHTTRRGLSSPRAILGYAEEHEIDLIILGTQGRQGSERFLIGSTAEKIARFARCPVLTVGPHGGRVAALARRILVPVDFSEPARVALREGRRLAARYRAKLFVAHVIEPVIRPVFYSDHPEVLRLNVSHIEERASEELDRFCAETKGPDVPTLCRVLHGRPGREVAAFAREEDVHLIVQGSRGLTGVEHVLLGSVAQEVIRYAPCPVLTVKHPPHDAGASSAGQQKKRAPDTTASPGR